MRGSERGSKGLFHNPALADARKAVEQVEREWQPHKVRQRYDWLYEYDATQLNVGAAALDLHLQPEHAEGRGTI